MSLDTLSIISFDKTMESALMFEVISVEIVLIDVVISVEMPFIVSVNSVETLLIDVVNSVEIYSHDVSINSLVYRIISVLKTLNCPDILVYEDVKLVSNVDTLLHKVSYKSVPNCDTYAVKSDNCITSPSEHITLVAGTPTYQSTTLSIAFHSDTVPLYIITSR